MLAGTTPSHAVVTALGLGESSGSHASSVQHVEMVGSASVIDEQSPGAEHAAWEHGELGTRPLRGADATDQAYLGLNWHVPITEAFFAEIGAGGTVHNGNLDSGTGPLLGCRFLFREHAALGVRVSETVNVMATIDHSSNANLCNGPNDGITHAGLAVGVRF